LDGAGAALYFAIQIEEEMGIVKLIEGFGGIFLATTHTQQTGDN
jgi:hypothetical protein